MRLALRGDPALRDPEASVAVGLPELEFALVDSVSARRFTRVDPLRSRSALRCSAASGPSGPRCGSGSTVSCWAGPADDKIEAGRKVRIDSTVTETHILEPSDSQLLYDAVRVLSRLLARGLEKLGPDAFRFHDHRRAAKRKKWKIPKARMKRKVKLYRELLAVVRRTLRTPMVPWRRSRAAKSRG